MRVEAEQNPSWQKLSIVKNDISSGMNVALPHCESMMLASALAI